jgi:putative ABC transport system permease protein
MKALLIPVKILRRSPGFLALATATMACGIGAAMALFAVVDSAFLRPMPYPDGDRIVVVQPVRLDSGKAVGLLPGPFFEAVRQNHGLELVAYVRPAELVPIVDNVAQSWRGAEISRDVVSLFGVRPILGTVFSNDDFNGDTNVVMLSRTMWTSRFGGDVAILGRSIRCEGRTVRVVGVFENLMLPAFPQPLTPEFLQPSLQTESELVTDGVLAPFARIRPGVTLSEVQAEMSTRLGVVASRYPQLFSIAAMKMSRLRDFVYGPQRSMLQLLLWAACGTVLIVCLNLSNLVLARQRFRRRELAVQAALGASRAALLLGLVTQNFVVALLAVPAGLVVTQIVGVTIGRTIPADLSQTFVPTVDVRTVLGAIAIAALVAVVASLVAARDTWRGGSPAVLLPGSYSGGSRRQAGKATIVALQTGAVLVLLVGAGLMINSVIRLERLDIGSETEHVFVLAPKLPLGRYTAAQALSIWRRLLDRVKEEPTVTSAALAFSVPMGQQTPWASLVGRDGGTNWSVRGSMIPISREYFQTLGIPLKEGRTFTQEEDLGGAHVGVVNASAARLFWPDASPIGRVFRSPWFPEPFKIIGIAEDTRFRPEVASIPTMYVPIWHERPLTLRLVMKSSQDKNALAAWLALRVREVDPSAVVPAPETYKEILAKWYARPVFLASVLTVFAALTLLMAAVGTAAVVGYSVVLRYRELGIRLALGATRSAIHRLVLKETLLPTVVGIVLGVAVAAASVRILQQELFTITTYDPPTYVVAVLVLVTAVCVSAYVPAWWAGRVDPTATLKSE